MLRWCLHKGGSRPQQHSPCISPIPSISSQSWTPPRVSSPKSANATRAFSPPLLVLKEPCSIARSSSPVPLSQNAGIQTKSWGVQRSSPFGNVCYLHTIWFGPPSINDIGMGRYPVGSSASLLIPCPWVSNIQYPSLLA